MERRVTAGAEQETTPVRFPGVPGGYVEESLDLGGQVVRFRRPADPDGLLGVPEVVAAFDRDGDAPYWPLLWPPAVAMARAVYRSEAISGAAVLEVGCGIGLAGLAAAARGANVTASDNQPDAVRLAVANAALNGLSVEGLVLDWRRPIDRTFDVILGCEVIYDAELHAPLIGLLSTMLAPRGEAWLADHGRMHAPLFARRAEAAGFAVSLVDENDEPLPEFRTAAYQMLKLRR
ncbi:MAG TPA: methyltransferase domain-containing protein [Planctomycetaceae bacterium]